VFELPTADHPREERQIPLTVSDARQLAAIEWLLPLRNHLDPLVMPLAAGGPWEAAHLGVVKTHQFMLQTYVTILRLFQGTVPVSEARGALGITHEGIRIAKMGWPYFFFFLGLISVNLAVMNFLPIPILDGGQMVFLVIEKLKGSPVSIKVQTIATYVGLAFIGGLLVMTLYFDAARILAQLF